MDMNTASEHIDSILTNGRVFAALMGEVVILPGGKIVSEEAAEDMGFDDEAEDGKLTEACLAAIANRVALLDNAQNATNGDTGYNPTPIGGTAALIYNAQGEVVGRRVWVEKAPKRARRRRPSKSLAQLMREFERLMAEGC